jgi:hypothetical protein
MNLTDGILLTLKAKKSASPSEKRTRAHNETFANPWLQQSMEKRRKNLIYGVFTVYLLTS